MLRFFFYKSIIVYIFVAIRNLIEWKDNRYY